MTELDRQQIRDACMAYWAGFDRGDPEVYLRAFTPDATMSLFDGKTILDVAKFVAEGGLGKTGFEHKSHTPGSQVITVDGDTACADTLVTAVLVTADGPVMVRGLRYLDDLVRVEDGWRISHRRHSVLWQYNAERVATRTTY
ncbi:nuclear transport factor 2 family protein [Amycolatopsis sp. GM8]|uniref:nuclear transport factor 2 family protein n=1 Tax=Amycolatopsis sp. GM8 TaxID=2896530 RepID=UPI001F1B9A15|nr:nuclear transport factor 2 family protein [Amycolatopsis sp. GM8]